MTEVTEFVNKEGLCSGCGVCAGVCPEAALSMEWNNHGEYNPKLSSSKCTKCGLCLKVCPFSTKEQSVNLYANLLHENDIAGSYKNIYSGFVPDLQEKRSGGGVATWLLTSLLEKKIVNKVACCFSSKDPERLFSYEIVDSIEDVLNAARTVYYPVELSGVIKEILENDGSYVVIALPCFVKALRLAMKYNKVLSERVTVIIGLVCGQQKSKRFAEYLCIKSGGDPRQIETASFRVKDLSHKHLDSKFEYKCSNSEIKSSIYQSQGS